MCGGPQYKLAYSAFVLALQRCDCSLAPVPSECNKDPVSLLDLGLAELAMGRISAANLSLSAALEVSEAQGEPLAEAFLGREQARLRMCDWESVEGEVGRLREIAASPSPEEEAGGALHSPQWLAPFGLGGGQIRLLTELFAAQALLRAPVPQGLDGGVVWGGKLAGDEVQGGGIRLGILVCGAYVRGADQQALQGVIDAPIAGKRSVIVYEWCEGSVQTVGQVEEDGEDEEDEEDKRPLLPSYLADLWGGKMVEGGARMVRIGGVKGERAAARINGDAIDVLITLDGWLQRNRNILLSYRPAPVQVAGLGHRGTMGDTRVAQHYLGGSVSSPPELSHHFTEHLVYLPLGHAPPLPLPPSVDPADRASARAALNATLASLQLTEASLVFSVLASSDQLSREGYAAWHALASSSPRHLVWVPDMLGGTTGAHFAREALRRGDAKPGGAAQRFVHAAGHGLDIMAKVAASDAVLDTLASSNGPVVALAGGTPTART